MRWMGGWVGGWAGRTGNEGIRDVLEKGVDFFGRDEVMAALDEVGQDFGHVLLVAGERGGWVGGGVGG